MSFIESHFANGGRRICKDVITQAYQRFEGTTWYVQKIANELYASTGEGECCEIGALDPAISHIVRDNEDTYKEILYRLTTKQKAVLIAINKAERGAQVTSSAFIKSNSLPSASSVQKALAALVEKGIVTCSLGVYAVYDYFFSIWLKENM